MKYESQDSMRLKGMAQEDKDGKIVDYAGDFEKGAKRTKHTTGFWFAGSHGP